MSRAVVLGGGGPVGIAWQAGLIVGLAGQGVDLATADLVVGTSAGSNVGARLALGHDLATVVHESAVRRVSDHADAPDRAPMASRLDGLMAVMFEAAAIDDAETSRAHIGAYALSADTGPEDDFLALFDALEGARWPTGYACTAIDAVSGEFVVWTEASGVPLLAAVASSCSVPGIFPPITVAGKRYYDGGLRTPLNADVAAGHDTVIAVSCLSHDMPGSTIVDEVEALRAAGGAAELVEPDERFVEISGGGMHLMDARRGPDAYEAGLALGGHEAERVGRLWA